MEQMKSCLEVIKNLLNLHSIIMIILWINPFEVSYGLGETTFILYKYKDEKTKVWEPNHVTQKPTCCLII